MIESGYSRLYFLVIRLLEGWVRVIPGFLRPGSVRIASNIREALPNVACVIPGGQKVVIVLNNGNTKQTFNIRQGEQQITSLLPAGAVGTYVW